eukprot:6206981-Pleurochrysis_carterae.AAC.2
MAGCTQRAGQRVQQSEGGKAKATSAKVSSRCIHRYAELCMHARLRDANETFETSLQPSCRVQSMQ